MPIIGVKPSSASVRVNKAHPIGQTLLSCILHNTHPYMPVDIVTGKVRPFATPASVAAGFSADGPAHIITADGLDQRIYYQTGLNTFDSVWKRWIVTPSVVSSAPGDMLYRSGASGTAGAYIWLNNSKFASESTNSAATLSAGTRYDFLLVYKRLPNTCDLYINGELDTAGFAHASDANAFTIYGDGFSQNIRGTLDCFMMGLGILDAGTARRMYQHPYECFESGDNYDSNVPTSPPPPPPSTYIGARYQMIGAQQFSGGRAA